MSAHPARDDVTDRLISEALRRQDAAMPGGRSASCPEAEMLAAFVERRLVAAEVSSLEEHLADCARCREILAALVRAMPMPAPAREPTRAWAGWLASPWRWAVPATAVVALLTVWVATRGPVMPPTQPEATVAEALPPRPEGVPPTATSEGRDVAPASPVGTERGRRQPSEKSEAPAGPVRQQPLDVAGRLDPTKVDTPAVTDEPAIVSDAPPPAPPPPVAAPALAAVAAESAAVAAQREEPEAAPRPEEKVAATPALPTRRAQETGRRALAPRASEIVAAGGDARWRFGFGGMLFRSSDGMTWEKQETGTTLDLLSGSAPSASVCWIVGREGLVLLTTDGEHWRRVPFPDTVDLVHVAARDGEYAVVTTADDRRFVTASAGQTWSRLP